jgi:hypothetical protein
MQSRAAKTMLGRLRQLRKAHDNGYTIRWDTDVVEPQPTTLSLLILHKLPLGNYARVQFSRDEPLTAADVRTRVTISRNVTLAEALKHAR